MAVTTKCPETNELEKLLDGSLSGERAQECMGHMDSCECCQHKLEEIATGGTNLSQIVEQINEAEPLATSVYWSAVKELNVDLSETFVPRRTRPQEVSLSFLQPASDPTYLGRLAHFDVMRIIGRGGMGIVLEAFDSRLQRQVAIKVLDPELLDDEVSRQRFCREARSAASITHENVVAVHQVERSGEEQLPYMVMQLISGESLEDRLNREKTLPLREIVRIGMQAAHGLAGAHAQNLIHRDIKPGNILLEPPHGRVKLTDFGLARVADDVRLTRTGFVTGTPLYMSPEQTLGKDVDHRSDLFSLGAILYEMCTGQPPFSGDSAVLVLKQIAEQKHRPIRELNPAIPKWFADTVEQLLEKKPENRIQTAAQLAELLDYEWALMKATSEEVPTVCKIEQQKQNRRNWMIGLGIGAVFLTVGMVVGSLFMGNRNGNLTVASGTSISPAKPVAVLNANAGAVWSVAFDPSGQSVVMGVDDGTARIWDVATQGIRETLNATTQGFVWTTRFCPDGSVLATGGDDGLIKMWDTSNGEVIKTFEHPDSVRGLVFTSNQKGLYAGGRKGELRHWTKDADEPVATATQPGTINTVALSPDNETLATAGSDKIVRLWNAKSLSQKVKLEGHAGQVYGLSFDQDGNRLASSSWDKTIRIWNAHSGQLVKSWEAHRGDVWSVAFSPDGTKLVSGGTDGTVKLWNPETGGLLASYVGHENAVHAVAFSKDGTQIASGGRDGMVRIWKVE